MRAILYFRGAVRSSIEATSRWFAEIYQGPACESGGKLDGTLR